MKADLPDEPKLASINKKKLQQVKKNKKRAGERMTMFLEMILWFLKSFQYCHAPVLMQVCTFFLPSVKTENKLCEQLTASLEGLGSKPDETEDYDFEVDFK